MHDRRRTGNRAALAMTVSAALRLRSGSNQASTDSCCRFGRAIAEAEFDGNSDGTG